MLEFFKKSKYDNINELLDKVIFDNKLSAIIIIDEATEELYNVLGQLKISTDVIETQTYMCGDKKLHRFSSFNDAVLTDLPIIEDADELNTIVLPDREDALTKSF